MKLVPDEDYGLIKASDGREIYFNRNSVIEMDFDDLKVGMNVHFNEEQGEQGIQASTVHVEGKHHVI
jgi:cold shock CspA family protein